MARGWEKNRASSCQPTKRTSDNRSRTCASGRAFRRFGCLLRRKILCAGIFLKQDGNIRGPESVFLQHSERVFKACWMRINSKDCNIFFSHRYSLLAARLVSVFALKIPPRLAHARTRRAELGFRPLIVNVKTSKTLIEAKHFPTARLDYSRLTEYAPPIP